MQIKVNDNKDLVKQIRYELSKNGGYCPCKIEHTPDTKCMCKEFREIKEGECHCGLYIKYKDGDER